MIPTRLYLIFAITLLSFSPLSLFAMGGRNILGPHRTTLEDCKIKWGGGIWDGPQPIFPYDLQCQHLIELAELPAQNDCGEKVSYEDLYQNFKGDFSQPVVANAGMIQVHGEGKYAYAQYLPAPQLSSSGVDLESQALDHYYCHKQQPQKVEDVFQSGFDVPAKVIDLWSKEYIEFKWGSQLSGLMKKYPDYDLPTFLELNITAAKLWKKMTTCFSGNSEMARAAYAQGKFVCTNSSIDGRTLRTEIASYLDSVEAYFMSSYFKPPKSKAKNSVDFYDLMMKGEDLVDVEIQELPSLHPLFTQAAMQTILKIYPMDESFDALEFEKNLKANNINTNLFFNVSQLFRFMPSLECSTLGLWPSAGRTSYNALVLRSQELIATAVKGYEVTDYNIQPVACGGDKYRLPYLYSDSKFDIALQYREIPKRYHEAEKK